MAYTADRNLYLDADGTVVEEDDERQATLLVARGATLPDAIARRHGLGAASKAQAPAEDKAVAGPARAQKGGK